MKNHDSEPSKNADTVQIEPYHDYNIPGMEELTATYSITKAVKSSPG
jgi:hypothetical protein